MTRVHCEDEQKQSIFKQSWKMNGLWNRGWSSAHAGVSLPRWNREMEEQKEGMGVEGRKDDAEESRWFDGNNTYTRDKAERKRIWGNERKRQAGKSPLEDPQSTLPEQCINISDTHTHTKTNSLAHSLHRHRGGNEAGRKRWSARLTYSSAESFEIDAFWHYFIFDRSAFSCLIHGVCVWMCVCWVWDYNTYCG